MPRRDLAKKVESRPWIEYFYVTIIVMSDDRKIIPFKKKFKKKLVSTSPNDMRAAATATLGFILFIMIGVNSAYFSKIVGSESEFQANVERGLASVPKVMETQWKQNLKAIAKEGVNEKQIARQPSTIDQLNFGMLQGQYSLQVKDGHVVSIRLNPDHAEGKVLTDRLDFIHNYAEVLAPGLKLAKKISTETEVHGFKESYQIEGANGSQTMSFHLDNQQRLISVDVK